MNAFLPADILMPKTDHMEKWAVIACDQFTSDQAYWDRVRKNAEGAVSTINLILPEAELGTEKEAKHTAEINATMKKYMEDGVFTVYPNSFVYVERTLENGSVREGLVGMVDLDAYDYTPGATSAIRATERTVPERIPPRLKIRDGALLELPHILVLIDDEKKTVIEPLAEKLQNTEKLYDFDLMQNGGHIEGWFVNNEGMIEDVISALNALVDPNKYGTEMPPLLFAMGDGNHSFATAKANWEKVKATLTPEEQADHPARFALVELENVHDDGIVFEPIHRVVFNVHVPAFLEALKAKLAEQNNGECEINFYDCECCMEKAEKAAPEGAHVIPVITENGKGLIVVAKPNAQLEVGTLQNALDVVLKATEGATIDYIHGADVVNDLGSKHGNIGFLLPPMEKSAFFRTVVFDGALPRKTFSMGEAHEKRYYLECRKICK